MFDGSVAECGTLEGMLTGLCAPKGALVIMDAGIATEDNIAWLVLHHYRYLVVKRGGVRQFDENDAISIETAGGEVVRIQKQTSEDGKEVKLYCHSAGRERKETGMTARFCERFETALKKIADGLQTPRGEKNYDKLMVRIGRIKQKSAGVSQHYQVDLVAEEAGDNVASGDVGAGLVQSESKKATGKKAKQPKEAVQKVKARKAILPVRSGITGATQTGRHS